MNSDHVTVTHLSAVLPEPPAEWERYDGGGAVQYRLPGTDGVRAAAKLTVRPDRLGNHAVRVDRIVGCHSDGTTRHADVDGAIAAIEAELSSASGGGANDGR